MLPTGVLMCEPQFFDVVDRKNPFMNPQVRVDRRLAHAQWNGVRGAFQMSGMRVELLNPVPACEDMVFTANPAFTGRDRAGALRAIQSRMRHESRQREVRPQIERLHSLGYKIAELPGQLAFEGGGDAVWHLGKPILYVAQGPRTDPGVDDHLARIFSVDVVPLRLRTERYYHLDSCLAVIDRDTAIVFPFALEHASYDELCRRFRNVIEIDRNDAEAFGANAARAGGNYVIIEKAARVTVAALQRHGFTAVDVDTSELRKSGGSVYCMKQYLF